MRIQMINSKYVPNQNIDRISDFIYEGEREGSRSLAVG